MPQEKVLIVEDDAIIAMRLQDTLESWGYTTAITASGERAIEWVSEFKPNLVLMDIRLDGGMDGIQAAELIRESMGPPTIFLTAYSDEELIERAKLTEPYGYLVKPVHERELRSTMEMALFKHRMDRKLQQSERQFRAIFEQAGVGVALVDSASGMFLQVNQKFCQIIGYPIEQVERRLTYQQVTHPEDIEPEQNLLNQLWKGELREFSIEKRYIRLDQSEVWVDLTVSAMWESGEAPTMHVAVVEDITARKLAEENLRRRVAELEAVNRISGALRSAEKLTQMLQSLLDELLEILGVQAGGIILKGDSNPMSEVVETRGWLNQSLWLIADPEKGFLKTIFDSPQTIYSDHLRDDPHIDSLARETLPAGWSAVVLPVQALDEVLGLMMVCAAHPQEFSAFEINLLETIAQIAGNTIHRMHLHEQTQRSLQRIAALHEIDTIIRSNLDLKATLGIILEQVVQQLGVDAADVLLSDASSVTLELAAWRGMDLPAEKGLQVRFGEGLAGGAALNRVRMIGTPANFEQEPPGRLRMIRDERIQYGVSTPLLSRGKVTGVLEVFHRSPLEPDPEWFNFLATLAGQVALAVEDLSLLENLHRTNTELVLAYDETIEGWSRAMDLRDRETEGHTRRVTEMTLTLAKKMGLPDDRIIHVRRGAMLHDIGKMGVPDNILHKPGPLTDSEWAIMRCHPQYAYELLSPIAYLELALDIPYCHHERWDGSGYPRGLKADQIPLAARLFAVVDVFDALTSDRPYRKAWSKEKTLEYILEQSGKHFDPEVVRIFLELFGE